MRTILLLLVTTLLANAENWPQFRGANCQGVSSETNLPETWSETENVLWKVDLPGRGSSSPVVLGEKVFLTSYTGYGFNNKAPVGKPEDLMRHLLCYHRDTGKLLWKKDVPNRGKVRIYEHFMGTHGYASHTPVTDGKTIYCWFGSHGAVAFDLDGNQLWENSPFDMSPTTFGSGASPVLFENLVLYNANLEGRLFVALDQQTGKEVWRRERIASYTTPVFAKLESGPEMIINRGNSLAAFDPRTGEDLWHCSHEHRGYIIPIPIVREDMVYAYNGNGHDLMAVKAGGRGNVSSAKLWSYLLSNTVPSPVFADGLIYITNQSILHCIRASDGELIYKERLPRIRDPYSSLLVADGKIYLTGRRGTTSVVKAGPSFELLATNIIAGDDSYFNASPAVSEGKLFIRSQDWLYCIGD